MLSPLSPGGRGIGRGGLLSLLSSLVQSPPSPRPSPIKGEGVEPVPRPGLISDASRITVHASRASANCDRINWTPQPLIDAQRRDHQHEFIHFVAREFIEIEELEQISAL